MFRSIFIYISIVFSASGIANSMKDFSFRNQSQWPEDFPDCGKKDQSPVNIDTKLVQQSTQRSQVIFDGYSNEPANLVMTNNGKTVIITGKWKSDDLIPRISGGPLEGVYIFDNIHFLWSDKDQSGSDHAIDGQRFSLEMHVTHRKENYDNLMDALEHPDGLAIVTIIYQKVDEAVGMGLSRLDDYLPKVLEKNDKVDMDLFSLDKLGTTLGSSYYTYYGSYVTPPCSISVTYLINKDVQPVSRVEMKLFRNISMDFGDTTNVRNLQDLGDRTVKLMINQ